MICEKLEGTLDNLYTCGKKIEYVNIEWHEAFKKIHKKVTDEGREVGIRMDDWVLTRGLHEGDVIYVNDSLVIAVHTPPCEVIRILVTQNLKKMIPKVCYEIGNRHAPLFYGDQEGVFITPYNEPMLMMLSKMEGVSVQKKIEILNFHEKISASVHSHHH